MFVIGRFAHPGKCVGQQGFVNAVGAGIQCGAHRCHPFRLQREVPLTSLVRSGNQDFLENLRRVDQLGVRLFDDGVDDRHDLWGRFSRVIRVFSIS